MSARLSLSALPRRVWATALMLLMLSGVVASIVRTQPTLVQTRTSYGGPPRAWGAAYDLLDALSLHPARSRLPIAKRDVTETQWLVEPSFSESEVDYEAAEIERFASGGGTVLLIGAPSPLLEALSFSLRASTDHRNTHLPASTKSHREDDATLPSRSLVLHETWLTQPRTVDVAREVPLLDGEASEESATRVFTTEGAFVLEHGMDQGRIVAVADSRFLTNDRLADHDNAPFVVDLVRRYGAPTFDEHCHGLIASRSPWAALGAGFMVLILSALSLTTGAAVFHARRWPLPKHVDDAPPAPTLEVFTNSLANLYRSRGAREPAAVFRAYQAGYLRRVQRAQFGDREVSQARFEARLEQDARLLGDDGAWLAKNAAPRSQSELTDAVNALERCTSALARTKNPS